MIRQLGETDTAKMIMGQFYIQRLVFKEKNQCFVRDKYDF